MTDKQLQRAEEEVIISMMTAVRGGPAHDETPKHFRERMLKTHRAMEERRR